MAKEEQENVLETATKADGSVDVAVDQKEKNLVSETKQTLSPSNLIKEFENEQLKKELPEIYVGDTVKVGVKITEGNRELIYVIFNSLGVLWMLVTGFQMFSKTISFTKKVTKGESKG